MSEEVVSQNISEPTNETFVPKKKSFLRSLRGAGLLCLLSFFLVAIVITVNDTRNNQANRAKGAVGGPSLYTFQKGTDGYMGTTDASLRSDRPNINYATNALLKVQADNWMESVLRFDLTSIPSLVTIQSARLELYQVSKNDSSQFTLQLYKLLKPWTEIGVTWNNSQAGIRWSSEGAGSIGKDREGTLLGSTTVNKTSQWYYLDVTQAVQKWITNPQSNFGFILRGNNANQAEYNFASSNHTSAYLRPRLTINISGGTPVPTSIYPTSAPTTPPIITTPKATPTTNPISPTPTPSKAVPTPTTAPGLPTPTTIPGSWWKPTTTQPIHMHWQIGTVFTPSTDFLPGVTVYDIDGFDNTAATVQAIKDRGYIAICYVDVGGWESYRPDAGCFTTADKGAKMQGWPEYYLDIRSQNVRNCMATRIQTQCKNKGFSAVEPDVIDAYANNSGFPLTAADQISYNRFLADTIHSMGMSAGLKGDTDQAPQLAPYFDWTLNEECAQYSECGQLNNFLTANKAVFQVEYSGGTSFCADANANHRNAQLRNLDLTKGGTRQVCIPDSQNTW